MFLFRTSKLSLFPLLGVCRAYPVEGAPICCICRGSVLKSLILVVGVEVTDGKAAIYKDITCKSSRRELYKALWLDSFGAGGG